MKPLPTVVEKRKMRFVQIERSDRAALYEQYINEKKIAFEVFLIKRSKGYTFPNGVTTPPAEVYPSDNDFGKTAWSVGIFKDEALSFDKAFLKFRELNQESMNKIDTHDEQVIRDAVSLLKSDFVALYKKMGFDENHTSVSWHTIRTSPQGRAMRESLYKGVPKHIQALSMITDFEEEVQDRKTKMNKKEKSATPQGGIAVEEKPKKSFGGSGEKGNRAKELIAQGVTDAKELAAQAGISKVYAGRLLEKLGKK